MSGGGEERGEDRGGRRRGDYYYDDDDVVVGDDDTRLPRGPRRHVRPIERRAMSILPSADRGRHRRRGVGIAFPPCTAQEHAVRVRACCSCPTYYPFFLHRVLTPPPAVDKEKKMLMDMGLPTGNVDEQIQKLSQERSSL